MLKDIGTQTFCVLWRGPCGATYVTCTAVAEQPCGLRETLPRALPVAASRAIASQTSCRLSSHLRLVFASRGCLSPPAGPGSSHLTFVSLLQTSPSASRQAAHSEPKVQPAGMMPLQGWWLPQSLMMVSQTEAPDRSLQGPRISAALSGMPARWCGHMAAGAQSLVAPSVTAPAFSQAGDCVPPQQGELVQPYRIPLPFCHRGRRGRCMGALPPFGGLTAARNGACLTHKVAWGLNAARPCSPVVLRLCLQCRQASQGTDPQRHCQLIEVYGLAVHALCRAERLMRGEPDGAGRSFCSGCKNPRNFRAAKC